MTDVKYMRRRDKRVFTEIDSFRSQFSGEWYYIVETPDGERDTIIPTEQAGRYVSAIRPNTDNHAIYNRLVE